MRAVIKTEGLGKHYSIRHEHQPRYATFRDMLAERFMQLRRRHSKDREEIFWALRDVDLEIHEGARVGIIGRNGAGKSTLLKLLSRITEPSQGRLCLCGRVASLLEVGTGFHPELSGRENIYLNGAILGMRRQEIRRSFDEIVAFAEVEKFLDTPVKRYSSGMYTRLAFSVAAHLEPDVLLVDEVLAVGDAGFQKKCLSKMESAANAGRTVLFVSHNMQAIKQLCDSAVILADGSIDYQGNIDTAVSRYLALSNIGSVAQGIVEQLDGLPRDPVFAFDTIALSQEGRPVETVETGKPLDVDIRFHVNQAVSALRIYVDLCDAEGTILSRSFHDEDQDEASSFLPGGYSARWRLPADLLGPASYQLVIRAGIHNVRSLAKNGVRIPLSVIHTGTHNRAYLNDTFRAKLTLPVHWELNGVDHGVDG